MGGSLLTVLLLVPAVPSEGDLLAQGNAAFRQGVALVPDPKQTTAARKSFAGAAAAFEQLSQSGVENALLYRNQGNAYLLAEDVPRAIRAYRRGLQLAPDDFELRRALAYAREQVVYSPPGTLGRPAIDHRPPWLPHLPGASLWVVLALYVWGCLGLARWRMIGRAAWLSAGLSAFVAAGLLGAALWYEERDRLQEQATPFVVVAADGVSLKAGNGRDYATRFPGIPLNRGVEARLRFERGDWLQIELAGGEVGWVPRAAVLPGR